MVRTVEQVVLVLAHRGQLVRPIRDRHGRGRSRTSSSRRTERAARRCRRRGSASITDRPLDAVDDVFLTLARDDDQVRHYGSFRHGSAWAAAMSALGGEIKGIAMGLTSDRLLSALDALAAAEPAFARGLARVGYPPRAHPPARLCHAAAHDRRPAGQRRCGECGVEPAGRRARRRGRSRRACRRLGRDAARGRPVAPEKRLCPQPGERGGRRPAPARRAARG